MLNVGCGGRSNDKACYLGDVRIDMKRLPPATMLMDAHFLGFRDSLFDRIVCFEVLEHLESPIKALKEFKRVLKENGEIIISVPNVWYWRKLLRALIKGREVFSEVLTTDHKQAWDIYEFHNLAGQIGLKVESADWLDWYPKGKLKLSILEPMLKFIPQISFTHVVFKLKHDIDQKCAQNPNF